MPIYHHAGGRMFVSGRLLLTSALALSAVLGGGQAASAKDLGDYGKITGDVRYRYENVDEEARPRNGIANTIRAHLGYQTPEWNNLYAFGEVETVRHLGPTDFDDGLNGKTEFGRINDPQMNGISQLFVNYKHGDDFNARLGRQQLKYDNQRFVAYSNSRQNDTAHDALYLKYTPLENLTLNYAYSMGYNRYSGERSTAGRWEGALNLLNAHYDFGEGIGLSGYSYWLDFDGVTAEENLSSRTHGLRLTWDPKGDGWHPLAAVEVAHQSDFGHSSLSYDEGYMLVDIGVRYNEIKTVFSYEQLDGNGTAALQTPIGSAHNVTGWTDKFTTTPVNGLRDLRVVVTAPYDLPWEGQSVELIGQAHWFTSDDGDIDYGREAGASLTYKPAKAHSINLKYSSYEAEDFSSDTNKLWFAYEYKF